MYESDSIDANRKAISETTNRIDTAKRTGFGADYNSLKETSYAADGMRDLLLKKNRSVVAKINDLKQQKINLQISQEEFTKLSSDAKADKSSPTVIIKATDKSTYKNLVDALDEMQICSISKYVIVPVTSGDKFLLENFKSKGAHSANSDIKQ